MDVFPDSATQTTLANLLGLLNFFTKQLKNAKFEANNVHVYPPLCRYCKGPHMSIDFQMENPFAQA